MTKNNNCFKVLSLDLKELKLSHERVDTGRLFQSSGAETAKAETHTISFDQCSHDV